jgi:hypothetical protein
MGIASIYNSTLFNTCNQFFVGRGLNMSYPFFEASVIEAAMPTQLLTLVIADGFQLGTEILALVIFSITVASLMTIPLIRVALF